MAITPMPADFRAAIKSRAEVVQACEAEVQPGCRGRQLHGFHRMAADPDRAHELFIVRI